MAAFGFGGFINEGERLDLYANCLDNYFGHAHILL